MRCSLFVVGCTCLIVWLCYFLLVDSRLLFVACCMMCCACCVLRDVRCSLFVLMFVVVVWCFLRVARSSLLVVR